MKSSNIQSLALIVIACFSMTASADVFKWTDDSGRVHYSDKPESQLAEAVNIKSKRTDYVAMNQAKQVKLDAELAAAADARAQQEINDENQANAEIREENCRRSKRALNSVVNAQRLYEPGENGERQYLNEAQINERRMQAQKDVDDWCDSAK